MKSFLFLLIGSQAFSATTSLIASMLNNQTILKMDESLSQKKNMQLMKIEQIAVYRCPNCYDFKLTYSGMNDVKKTHTEKIIQVRGNPDNSLAVTINEP